MFPSRFAYVLNSYLNCNALRKPPLEHFDLLLLCYGLADRARNSEPAKEWAVTRHEVDETVFWSLGSLLSIVNIEVLFCFNILE